MRYIDLFAGVGGFRYGMEGAKNWEDWECVWSNEWDKYANSVYRNHFGDCDPRDIRTVSAHEIPAHDLLCAGFPCQAFSVAGKRGGFEDTRGTLFFEIARIVSHHRPRYLLLENVKGLLSHESGQTFQTIIRVLTDLGYDCQWQVLNSKDFGVPQNRERVFIVGHLRDKPRPQVFPLPGSGRQDNQVRIKDDQQGWVGGDHQSQNGGTTERRAIPQTILRQPLRFLTRNQRKIEGDYAFTVDASNTAGVNLAGKIRRLTPLECERLQGFPDDWTKYGVEGELMSDTQRYKMMGNAVTTNVVTAIMERW